MPLPYLDAPAIVDVDAASHAARYGTSATGYGPKVPTRFMVKLARGPWRRVYAAVYGNSGSLYVVVAGVDHYLSSDAEYVLETVRDGGTVAEALASIAASRGE